MAGAFQSKFSFEIVANCHRIFGPNEAPHPAATPGLERDSDGALKRKRWHRVGFFDDSYKWLRRLLIARTLGLRPGQRCTNYFL